MGYTSSGGPKGLGAVTDSNTPLSDFNQIIALIARVGGVQGGTQTDRDAISGGALYRGLLFSYSDKDQVDRYDGTGWRMWDRSWTAYTPTLTNVSGSPTVTARYAVCAGVVSVKINIALGGANFGTGPLISLPVTARTPSGLPPVGVAIYNDVSATVWVVGTLLLQNTTQVAPLMSQVSGSQVTTQFNVSATAPFTWASGDSLTAEFSYEAA